MNDRDLTLREEYLDDRMDPHAREQFEHRLRDDPQLARAVESAIRIRSALREPPPALSSVFYTRAGERFEARRRGKFFGQALSRSRLGLAAAVLIVVAIFVPIALRDEIPGMPETKPQAEQSNEANEETSGALDSRDDLSSLAYVERLQKTTPHKKRKAARQEPALAEAQANNAVADTVFEKQEMVTAPAASPGVGSPALSTPRQISNDLIARGAVELLRAAPSTRLLLIGARRGLDGCESISVSRTVAGWELAFEESGSESGTVSCAIDLPDDGREIQFQGEPVR